MKKTSTAEILALYARTIPIEDRDYYIVTEELTISDILNRFNSALSEEEIKQLLDYEI